MGADCVSPADTDSNGMRKKFAFLPDRNDPFFLFSTRQAAGALVFFGKQCQALKKANRSALMTSAWVVAMPCGKPL